LVNCQYGFYCGGTTTNHLEHGTFHYVTNLLYPAGTTQAVTLVNTLLVGVTSNASYQAEAVVQTNGSAPIFQTVGGGSYYLAEDSPFRDAGTTNISSSLRAAFAHMTTYPPFTLNTQITTDTVLTPVVLSDPQLPDWTVECSGSYVQLEGVGISAACGADLGGQEFLEDEDRG
jgi:hypothetical protein